MSELTATARVDRIVIDKSPQRALSRLGSPKLMWAERRGAPSDRP